MRGNLIGLGGSTFHDGSIPACAGEPPQKILRPLRSRVYPRVCGGTVRKGGGIGVSMGLSPRVRGTGLKDPGRTCQQGLSPRVRGNLGGSELRPSVLGSIPACAGEPRLGLGNVARRGVYPRVCGGTAAGRRRVRQDQGLSPRVRGNLSISLSCAAFIRSIPACAGEP